jgi:hypothetical protein
VWSLSKIAGSSVIASFLLFRCDATNLDERMRGLVINNRPYLSGFSLRFSGFEIRSSAPNALDGLMEIFNFSNTSCKNRPNGG